MNLIRPRHSVLSYQEVEGVFFVLVVGRVSQKLGRRDSSQLNSHGKAAFVLVNFDLLSGCLSQTPRASSHTPNQKTHPNHFINDEDEKKFRRSIIYNVLAVTSLLSKANRIINQGMQ